MNECRGPCNPFLTLHDCDSNGIGVKECCIKSCILCKYNASFPIHAWKVLIYMSMECALFFMHEQKVIISWKSEIDFTYLQAQIEILKLISMFCNSKYDLSCKKHEIDFKRLWNFKIFMKSIASMKFAILHDILQLCHINGCNSARDNATVWVERWNIYTNSWAIRKRRTIF